jgi:hypothetical protein
MRLNVSNCTEKVSRKSVLYRFAPGYKAADHLLVALCEAPHNKRMQQTIPPANKFASGLAPDPQRSAVSVIIFMII